MGGKEGGREGRDTEEEYRVEGLFNTATTI
jgi:hypothetical protein